MAVTHLALLMMLTVVSYTDAEVNIYEQLEEINDKLALLEANVFFMASFNSTYLHVPSGTLKFDKIVVNIGNAYKPETGVFTVPLKGVYVFFVQSFTKGSGLANWDLYINGEMVLRAQSPATSSTSNMYMYPTILKPGDTIYVSSRNDVEIWGPSHSIFGGGLLRGLPN